MVADGHCSRGDDGGTDCEPATPVALGRELRDGHDVLAPGSSTGWGRSPSPPTEKPTSYQNSHATPPGPHQPTPGTQSSCDRPSSARAPVCTPCTPCLLGGRVTSGPLPSSQPGLAGPPRAAPMWPKMKCTHRLSGTHPGSVRKRFSHC